MKRTVLQHETWSVATCKHSTTEDAEGKVGDVIFVVFVKRQCCRQGSSSGSVTFGGADSRGRNRQFSANFIDNIRSIALGG